MKRKSNLLFILTAALSLGLIVGCLSEPAENGPPAGEELRFSTIDEAHEKWIEFYNSSSEDLEQLYTQRGTSYFHTGAMDIFEGSTNIATYLSSQPYGAIRSRTSLQLETSYSNYFEYGYYETADSTKLSYCILWVKENRGFRKEAEVIIPNYLSDTENIGHIEEAYAAWNDGISISGNIDDFFDSSYDEDVFYYNSYLGQSFYGFNAAKNVYRQWIGIGLRIGTPQVYAMENLQDDISVLFTNWKQGSDQGHVFVVYRKQEDGTWKTLIEID